jgi:lipoprotein-anchoring transpeptidase ErfK/SrfK
MKTARLLIAALAALTSSQCTLPSRSTFATSWFSPQQEVVRRPLMVQPAQPSSSPLFVWHGASNPGSTSINIDLSEQKAYIFKDRQNVGWTYVATGRSGFATPTGSFRIMEKIADKRSNRYGTIVDRHGNVVNGSATAGVHRVPSGGRFVGAKMPYWMRITGYGIGLHAGNIPRPGSPASHGCIRLPHQMAETLYQNADVGTRVTIVH